MSLPSWVEAYRDIWSSVASEMGVPPFLVAAIGDRETKWGTARELSEPGPGGTGDGGHGRGLMQIDDRAWPEWCAARGSDGEPLWKDPRENVRQGCRVIRAAWSRLLDWPATICAYNAGVGVAARVLRTLPPGTPLNALVHALDLHTTGTDYVTAVLLRWANWQLGHGVPFTVGFDGVRPADRE